MDETVELTAEEQEAALKAALSMKMDSLKAEEAAAEVREVAEVAAKEAGAAAQAYAEEQARLKVERRAEPRKFVGLMEAGASDPSYQANPAGSSLERTLYLNSHSWEHVSEDVDGVWIYRRL